MNEKLKIEEANELRNALLDAFPNPNSLEQVLYFQLGAHLDQIAGGGNYSAMVRNLIIWAESEDKTDALIRGARVENPGNRMLQRFEQEYRQRRAALPSAGVTENQLDPSKPMPIRILFLAANPKGTGRLRLDEEVRTIDERLRLAQFRDRFELIPHFAVRTLDLSEVLLRHTPHIVHFSGHGSDQGEIILEDAVGNAKPVTPAALGQLFQTLKDNIRCVMLNACFSATQARAIVKEIDCVAGMTRAIGDEAAIRFAAGFYQALGYGRSIKTAFENGRSQIELDDLGEEAIPQLLVRRGAYAAKIAFTS